MADTKFLKPAAGMKVRLENATRHLLAEGEEVDDVGLLAASDASDGDVTEAKPPKPPKES